jgi:hypothetical protein
MGRVAVSGPAYGEFTLATSPLLDHERLIQVAISQRCTGVFDPQILLLTDGGSVLSLDANLTPHVVSALLGRKIVQIAASCDASQSFCLALEETNCVYSWGGNGAGQLGLGDLVNRQTPTPVVALHSLPVKKIRCGDRFGVAITELGQVYIWGDNGEHTVGHGTLGLGHRQNSSLPQLICSLEDWFVVDVAAGKFHAIAILGEKPVTATNKKSL